MLHDSLIKSFPKYPLKGCGCSETGLGERGNRSCVYSTAVDVATLHT